MDNKKYEQLIDLIINENEEQARELFHEIVVEKSREIYESIMDEEVMEEGKDEDLEEGVHADEMEEGMGGQVGDLLDEINSEEAGGMTEGEDEADIEFDDEAEEDGKDLTHDLEKEHDDEGGKEELEDRVVDLEDKLDELMAEFEALMGGDADMGGEEEVEVDAEEEVMEAVQLQKVSVTHGDNGAQTKSTVAANSGAKGMDSKPVKFSGDNEAVPTGPKGPKDYLTKGEGDLPGAGKFKNVPGGKAKVDLTAAPKPVTKDGAADKHSPVAKG
jgi:hypothetical protein